MTTKIERLGVYAEVDRDTVLAARKALRERGETLHSVIEKALVASIGQKA